MPGLEASPLLVWERVARIARCETGEGFLAADADPSSVAVLTAFASRHLLPQGEKGRRAPSPHPESRFAEQRLLGRGLRAPVLRRGVHLAAEFGGGAPAPARAVKHAARQRDPVARSGGEDALGLPCFAGYAHLAAGESRSAPDWLC